MTLKNKKRKRNKRWIPSPPFSSHWKSDHRKTDEELERVAEEWSLLEPNEAARVPSSHIIHSSIQHWDLPPAQAPSWKVFDCLLPLLWCEYSRGTMGNCSLPSHWDNLDRLGQDNQTLNPWKLSSSRPAGIFYYLTIISFYLQHFSSGLTPAHWESTIVFTLTI